MEMQITGSRERLSQEKFSSLFENFKVEAFRLETLPAYGAPQDDVRYASYLRGDPIPAQGNESFLALIRDAKASGKTYACARLIPEEMTPYVRYELDWCFPYNYEAGQVSKLINWEEASPLLKAQFGKDFWLFDEEVAVAMVYEPDGTYVGADLLSNPIEKKELIDVKRTCWTEGRTLPEYLQHYRANE